MKISAEKRQIIINKHKNWIKRIKTSGSNVTSGYLIDENGKPGGGGLLIIEANSYQEAKFLILQDPMIKSGLVDWELSEWIPVKSGSPNPIILDTAS